MGNFRDTAQWKRLRLVILKRDGYCCQICGCFLRGGRADKSNSIMRPAVVDHIVPFDWVMDKDAATNPANLWSVCDRCDGSIIRPIEDRHRNGTIDAKALRRDKLAASVVGLDGYRSVPEGRPIDGLSWP